MCVEGGRGVDVSSLAGFQFRVDTTFLSGVLGLGTLSVLKC